jgi:hypothetical protein
VRPKAPYAGVKPRYLAVQKGGEGICFSSFFYLETLFVFEFRIAFSRLRQFCSSRAPTAWSIQQCTCHLPALQPSLSLNPSRWTLQCTLKLSTSNQPSRPPSGEKLESWRLAVAPQHGVAEIGQRRAVVCYQWSLELNGGHGGTAQVYLTPPMNFRGSGAEPEKSAPEKSKPGFCDANDGSVGAGVRRDVCAGLEGARSDSECRRR